MIDLRSDTITKPSEEMRTAMAEASVGDDVYGEDPTINELEEASARILGKEQALFVTSGTQGNQIAVLSHCVPGNEVLMEDESHIFNHEGGAISAFAGVQTKTLPGVNGALQASDVAKAFRDGADVHQPETGLICVENTHNRAGGQVVSPEEMAAVMEVANEHDVPVHLDGARLFNAAVASDRPITDFTRQVTTVQVCLSKGLGAPVGSMIAGDEAFITRARKWRKRLGGGMRQAGVLAAPGLIALTKNVDRLADDHENARRLAEGILAIEGLRLKNDVKTNIVVVDVSELDESSKSFTKKLAENGVLAVPFGPENIRLVTHLDVSKTEMVTTLESLQKTVKQYTYV